MDSPSSSALFKPLKVGAITLGHRVALAPLTRYRADANHVHTELGRLYYEQRGSTPGTLLITEGTFISPQAGGMDFVPGVSTEEQIAAWKRVVDAVHARGSFIFLQLWALGRAASLDSLTKDLGDKAEVVSASDVPLKGQTIPRPLTEEEIGKWAAAYAQAAKNFVEGAGGDGVEIHGANGYLVDQFLQTNTNKRTDSYGGSAENRTRFALEVIGGISKAVGEERTAIRLSPYSAFQEMKMPHEDIKETFSLLVSELAKRHSKLAYIHIVEPRVNGIFDQEPPEGETLDFLTDIWAPRPVILAGGLTAKKAVENAERIPNSIQAFGRYFISSPDLPRRIRHDVDFTPYNRKTFYTPSKAEGYTDYEAKTPIFKSKA